MVADVRAGGLLLAFEGIDGCGKSTQASRFVERLKARDAERVVHLLREPGGTEFGERVRDLLLHGEEMDPLSETLLYMASRAELYAQRVLPALARGELVVLDRTHYSTVAYQGAGLDVDEALILQLARVATRGVEPACIVLLDIPVEVAVERLNAGQAEGPDRIEARSREYFERVRASYLRFAAAAPDGFVVLDGRAEIDLLGRDVDAVLLPMLPGAARQGAHEHE